MVGRKLIVVFADGMLHSTIPAEKTMAEAILQRPDAQLCVADREQVQNP